MSFTITCDKCGNKLQLEDKGHYNNPETIDLLPEEDRDYDGFLNRMILSLYCKNEECNNQIEVDC